MGDHGDEEDHGTDVGNAADGPDYSQQPRRDDDDNGKKRRRRRGGRRHRERRERAGGRQQGGQQQRRPEGLPNDDELDAEAAALEARERAAVKSFPPPANVVKTGSADKHLADDEPADREPVARPRSYRDLDALPEYDDE
jgi:hypothetical protein